MKYSTNKDINVIVRNLIRQGWSFSWGAKHGRLRHPLGQLMLTVPKTPSDKRALLNFSRDVKRILID
jgi:hypothetical protein